MSKRIWAGTIAGISMLTASAPVVAAPSCWGAREVSAARVRQMQTMLMVTTLRCRAAGIDISNSYNEFVTAEQDEISAENAVIKQHFAQAGGTQTDYDRFATSLANGYGDDETSRSTCADAATLSHEGSTALTSAALERIAVERLFPTALPDGAYGTPVGLLHASAVPTIGATEMPAPIVMATAPVTEPQPVALPSDVVAALTVLARFQAAQSPSHATDAPTQVAGLIR